MRAALRRLRAHPWLCAAIAFVLAAGGVAGGYFGTRGTAASAATAQTRTETVTTGTVKQTVSATGTLAPAQEEQLNFLVSGQVTTVAATTGQKVRKGQALATVDSAALAAAQAQARAQVASAQATASPSGAPSGGSSGGTGGSLTAQVKAAQQQVIAAQHAVDLAQADVDAAQQSVDNDVATNTRLRDAQVAACGSSASDSSTSSDAPSTSAGDPTDCPTAMVAYQASADTLAADLAVLDAKLGTQRSNTKALETAIANLDLLVGRLQSTGSSATGSTHGATAPTGTSNGTGSRSGSSAAAAANSAADQPAGAAQLAADQAAIDAAQAEVTVARQDLAAAVLTSPTDGRVAALELEKGASSSGRTITIVGTGVQGVAVTVPLAQIDQVKTGQRVTVTADGSRAVLHGTVTAIGLVSSSSGSTTTFPVTVRLDADSPRLYDGVGADAVITTGTARAVLVVPNSAVHAGPAGTRTVTVASGGRTTTVPVTVGLTGDDVTEIKTGLKTGQQVVLADLGAQLPSSASSASNGLVGNVANLGKIARFVRGGN